MSAESTPVPDIDVTFEQWVILRDILKRCIPHYEVWAFGSRAKRTAKPYSDLDLAVISPEPISLDIKAWLAEQFSESDLPWKVDVVDWAVTDSVFRDVIKQNKVLIQRPAD